jgi:hypothetical protein
MRVWKEGSHEEGKIRKTNGEEVVVERKGATDHDEEER